MKKCFALVAVAATLLACEKTDNINPGFEYVNVNGEPDFLYITSDGEFNFEFSASDNEELKFVTVGTNKGFTAETNIDKAGNDLQYGNNFSLDGKNRVEKGFIGTEGAASGTYHLEFNVFDANDNKGITRRVNFVYQNMAPGSRPFWNVNSVTPTPGGNTIFINRGNEIVIDAEVTSGVDLSHIKVEMMTAKDAVLVLKKDLPGDSDFSFSMSDLTNSIGEQIPLIVPVTAAQLKTPLVISAVDANGQAGILYYVISVQF